jgi:hypothetical protein
VADLIKRLRVPDVNAVAMGTLLQTVSVIVQSVFMLVFLAHLIPLHLACLGLFFCMVGGRLAPFILTRPFVKPHAKLILAVTAFAMGATACLMIATSLLKMG